MRAIVYREYGPPDVLKLEEMEQPVPGDNEVLVRVRAASVNPLDWHFMRGTPLFLRLLSGFGKPRFPRLGRDLAGVVEAVGKDVRQFKPGDAVYGTGRGAFAELACAAESELAPKPEKVSFPQAACVPIAGLTALQGLRDKVHAGSGKKILINGAAGGVGTFAVQLGKGMGAEITAVCSARNGELVRTLGADHVIDYAREDFTRGPRRFDGILECVGNHPFSECRRVLNPGGVWVGIGAGGPDRSGMGMLVGMLKNVAVSWFSSQKMAGMMAKITTADLNVMSELITAGKVTSVIDLEYKLAEVPEAIRYLEAGHARGKVAIVI
jgi:NADPH:quinone reductase-like Zn-dependent oxidoreductase